MTGCGNDPRTPVTPHDQAQLDRFAKWLRFWGSTDVPFAEATPAQQAFRRACLADPEWREFLNLPPHEPS